MGMLAAIALLGVFSWIIAGRDGWFDAFQTMLAGVMIVLIVLVATGLLGLS